MSYIILRYQLFIAVSNSDSTSEPYTGAVIGGAVGGAITLLIIFVLCMVVYSVCWSCKKKSYKFTNKELAELGSDIIMGTNPSSDINNQSTKEEPQYDFIESDKIFQCLHQDDKKDNIKWDINPSHGGVQEAETAFYDNTTQPGCDVAIQVNLSCCSHSREISKDQDSYAKTDQYHLHSREVANDLEMIVPSTNDKRSAGAGDTYNVKTDANPSYDSMPGGVKLVDNPSYSKIKFT